MPMPYLVKFANDPDLYAYLARLNEDGHHPELAATDDRGVAFIATLTDPDADHVHHVVTDDGGYAHTCDDYCLEAPFAPCTWRPTYPVTVLSAQDPGDVSAAIATEAKAQAARDDARITAAQKG